MKKTLPLIFLCILHTFLSYAQSINWQWVETASGDEQEGYAVATDANGNIYLTGAFACTGTGDSAYFGTNAIITAPGSWTTFLAKYSSSGTALWAKTAVVSSNEQSTGGLVTTGKSGNVYLAGAFTGDSLIYGNTNLGYANMHNNNLFLVNYDSLGNVLWAKRLGDSLSSVSPGGIAADQQGNVFLTGYFTGDSVVFGATTLFNTGVGFFVIKYDSAGNVVWVQSNNSQSSAIQPSGIAVDETGSIFVTGAFGDTLAVDSIVLYNTNPHTNEIFLLRYNEAGRVIWGRAASGVYNNSQVNGIATDGNGNSFITGAFVGDSLVFGPYNLRGDTLNAIFIVKYDSSGNASWAKKAGGDKGNNDIGYGVAASREGNCYLSGSISSDSITFDPITLHYPTSYMNLGDPMFVVSLDPNGNAICADAVVSGGDDVNAICVDKYGDVYVGGDLTPVVRTIFGKDTINPSATSEFAFLAKFNCSKEASGLLNLNETHLLQIYPNPFSNRAIVNYALPPGTKNATLIVYDLAGRQRDTYKLPNTETQITINASKLCTGLYFYSLVVDGRVIDTKKMVVE